MNSLDDDKELLRRIQASTQDPTQFDLNGPGRKASPVIMSDPAFRLREDPASITPPGSDGPSDAEIAELGRKTDPANMAQPRKVETDGSDPVYQKQRDQQLLDAVDPSKRKAASSQFNWKDAGANIDKAYGDAAMDRSGRDYFDNIINGYKADRGASDQIIARAKEPAELAKQQQSYELSNANEDRIKSATAKSAADNDPNSPESIRQKASYKKIFTQSESPELAEAIDGLSAADIKGVNGDIMGMLKLAVEKKKADAKKKQEDDPNSANNTAWRETMKNDPRYAADVAKAIETNTWNNLTEKSGESRRKGWDENKKEKLQGDHNKAEEDIAQANLTTRKDIHGDEQADKRAEKLAPIIAAEDDLAHLNALRGPDGSLPGIGKIEAGKQYMDSHFGTQLSDPKAIEARKLLNQTYLNVRRALTGVAFSKQEADDIKAATLDPDTSDPRQIEAELKISAAQLASRRKNWESAYGTGGTKSSPNPIVSSKPKVKNPFLQE